MRPFLQSIEVKYIGPTNFKGSRYKAISASGLSLTVDARADLNPEENALLVAKLLQKKHNWKGRLLGGSTRKGFVFVQLL